VLVIHHVAMDSQNACRTAVSFRWNDELMALNFHGKFSMQGAMPAHF
jgi:hypothetical protein